MKNKSHKFNPLQCGLVKIIMPDGEVEYCVYKDNKIIGKLYHVNYWQGLPIEWSAYKVVHCFDASSKQHKIFDGKIPTNSFGKQLIKNLFY